MNIKPILLLFISLVLAINVCFGMSFKGGESYVLPAGQILTGDLYVAGSIINILGTLNGDLIAAGSTVQILGEVNGDVNAVGSTVTILGNVSDDVRVGAGTLDIMGRVGDSVLAGTGYLTVHKGAYIGGDLVAGAGNISISGPIQGNATLSADLLVITESGSINGFLNYTSDNEAIIMNASSVSGQITHIKQESKGAFDLEWILFGVFGYVMTIGGAILTGLLMLIFFRKLVEDHYKVVSKNYLSNGLWGFAFLILIPVFALILCITIIGVTLGMLTLGVYSISLYITYVLACFFFGRKLFEVLKIKKDSRMLELILGVITLELIGLIPFIGWFIKFLIHLVAFGAGMLMLKEFLAHSKSKRKKS